jgi:hypothetical protein
VKTGKNAFRVYNPNTGKTVKMSGAAFADYFRKPAPCPRPSAPVLVSESSSKSA